MQARYLDDSARHDAFTFGLAMEYLKSVQPRVLYIAFDETDDWAHSRRYDRVLNASQVLEGAPQRKTARGGGTAADTRLHHHTHPHAVPARRATGTPDVGTGIACIPRFHHLDCDLRPRTRQHFGRL